MCLIMKGKIDKTRHAVALVKDGIIAGHVPRELSSTECERR